MTQRVKSQNSAANTTPAAAACQMMTGTPLLAGLMGARGRLGCLGRTVTIGLG